MTVTTEKKQDPDTDEKLDAAEAEADTDDTATEVTTDDTDADDTADEVADVGRRWPRRVLISSAIAIDQNIPVTPASVCAIDWPALPTVCARFSRAELSSAEVASHRICTAW